MSKSDPEFRLAVFCDISKAFDVINHDILLKKMNIDNYRIRSIGDDWFVNDLSNRQQFVEVGGMVSDITKVIEISTRVYSWPVAIFNQCQ